MGHPDNYREYELRPPQKEPSGCLPGLLWLGGRVLLFAVVFLAVWAAISGLRWLWLHPLF